MSIPKVSIICPIYNAENTLCRMLDSLKAQTMSDFEVLMIDDGSIDSSGQIIDRYATSDIRFKAIHKQNGGVAAARQTGLDNASGEYVIHADADDWVDCNMLDEMYNAAISSRADILICDFFVNTDDREEIQMQNPTDATNNEQTIRDLFNHLHGSCCNKLVKLSCIRQYKIHFQPGINYCEDLLFNITVLLNPVKVKYSHSAFYHYYCDEKHNSIINSNQKIILNNQLKVVDKLTQLLSPLYYNDLIINYKIGIKHGLIEFPVLSNHEYQNIFPEIKWEVFSSKYSTVERILLFISVIGFYHTAAKFLKFKNFIARNNIR